MKCSASLRKRLVCLLLTGFLVSITPLSVSAESLEEIQAQQEQLQAENQKLQSTLDSLREDEAQKQEYLDTLQQQIDVVQEQILTTRENITDLNGSIQELTMKLDKSQKAVQDTIDQFKERLVAIYTAGNVSTLEVLLDSHSLSDFTTRMAMLDSMEALMELNKGGVTLLIVTHDVDVANYCARQIVLADGRVERDWKRE